MPLTVLSIAYPFAPVGPKGVGGAEQILGDMDSALVSGGHRSLVVACEGSEPAGELFPAPMPRGSLEDADRGRCRMQFQAAIDVALSERKVDLIHMHGLDFYEYRLPEGVPVLVTLHMPISWYPRDALIGRGANLQLQCVSESQRMAGPVELRGLPVVENGVELPPTFKGCPKGTRDGGDKDEAAQRRNTGVSPLRHAMKLRDSGRDDTVSFAMVLGRICPEKNLHEALEAGALAGTPVLIGGQVFPYRTHVAYFHERVEPLLGEGHVFLGPLTPERKRRLLAEAKCLLQPTLAPETSSLVAMEALAAGRPVIAYRSGALPEIIEDGVTGFLVDGVEEMAAAIRKVDTVSPAACRAVAERRFSRERMVRDYLRLYGQLIGAGRLQRVYA